MGKLQTVGSRLAGYGGVGPGFDYLRLGLALLVFNAHAKGIFVANSDAAGMIAALVRHPTVVDRWYTWREPLNLCLVPMFFALSGFLVAGSALRVRNVPVFLSHRLLRIIPALAVETVLSALILGPLFTALPLRQYFASPTLFRYLGNIMGWIDFYLPGVFLNSQNGIVNNSLWTLPAEFLCYSLLTLAMITTLAYRPRFLSGAFVVFSVGICIFLPQELAVRHGNFRDWFIVYSFVAGCVLFHLKSYIPASHVLTAAVALLIYVLLWFKAPIIFLPILFAFFVASLGLINAPSIPLISKNDYSYGIYLYGYPITQAIHALMPSHYSHVIEILGRSASLLVTLVFAAASWHLLERHALALKRYFKRGNVKEKSEAPNAVS